MTHKHKTRFTLLLILFFAIVTLSITYASTEKIIFKDNTKRQNNSSSEQSITFNEKKLNKGYYRANFNIKNIGTKHDEVIGNIIIDSKNNSHISYYKEIYGKDFLINKEYTKFTIEFEISKDNSIVLPNVYITKNSILSVLSMNIEKIKKPKNKEDKNIKMKIYEEDDLFSNGGIVTNDDNVENKKILISNKNSDINKYIIFGPYSENEMPGKQKAIFKLKTNNNKIDKHIAKIEVFNPNGNGVNKYLRIKGTDFKEENIYQDFEIDYIRTNSGSIEFRILYLGNSNLIFDKITNIGEY